jgi:hypothetical protein
MSKSVERLNLEDQQAESRLKDPTQVKPLETIATYFQMRRDPVVLEGGFLEILRAMYSFEDNLLHHTKPWDPSGKTKGSPYIDVDSTWEDSENNPYPMVIVALGDLKYSTQGVQGLGDNAGYNLEEGIQYQARVVNGTVTFNHIGKSKSQVLSYQASTLDMVDSFAEMIKRDVCFEKFDVTDIFKPRQRKDQPREWEAGVRSQFRFQEFFGNKQESPKLKQMSIKMKSGLDQRFKMVQ